MATLSRTCTHNHLRPTFDPEQEEAINNEHIEVIDKGRQIVLNFCL